MVQINKKCWVYSNYHKHIKTHQTKSNNVTKKSIQNNTLDRFITIGNNASINVKSSSLQDTSSIENLSESEETLTIKNSDFESILKISYYDNQNQNVKLIQDFCKSSVISSIITVDNTCINSFQTSSTSGQTATSK